MIYLHKGDKFKHTSCFGKHDSYDKLVKAIQGSKKQAKCTCLSATIAYKLISSPFASQNRHHSKSCDCIRLRISEVMVEVETKSALLSRLKIQQSIIISIVRDTKLQQKNICSETNSSELLTHSRKSMHMCQFNEQPIRETSFIYDSLRRNDRLRRIKFKITNTYKTGRCCV